ALGVVVAVQRQAYLFEVVGAGRAVGGFADLLHRGHEQADQHPNDGDNHQKFDQREGVATISLTHRGSPWTRLRFSGQRREKMVSKPPVIRVGRSLMNQLFGKRRATRRFSVRSTLMSTPS